ncbi:abortive infection protein, C-terminal domain protein [Propionimicrobium sp. BV2F7]|nr:abortive infection protein, C-terminal domain protein [Propionimicrobium sp. BV2F7]
MPEAGFEDSSARRTRTNDYLNAIDWTDANQCNRAIKAMERILIPISPEMSFSYTTTTWDVFTRYLREDGWEINLKGEISPLPYINHLSLLSAVELKDASAIHEQLERLRRSQDDPAAVIGAAKELIESTAKVILNELNKTVEPKAKFNVLVKQVQAALGLDPSTVSGVDGEQSTKRILGGASSIAFGLNELRNAGHGTGHGPATARVGLHPRHARLAVNAAALWCELILETYADPKAPWRQHP